MIGGKEWWLHLEERAVDSFPASDHVVLILGRRDLEFPHARSSITKLSRYEEGADQKLETP